MNIKRIICLLLCIVMIVPGAVAAAQNHENERYVASEGFSTVQGKNNWYYKCRNSNTDAVFAHTVTQETDQTTVWCTNGSNSRGYISADTMLPGIEANVAFDVIRVFSVSKSGMISIDTNGVIGAKNPEKSDDFGVKIRVTKNGSTIYPINGDWEELKSRSDTIHISDLLVYVSAGDEICFEARRTINKPTAQEMRQNIIVWDPVLSYVRGFETKIGVYSDSMETLKDEVFQRTENGFNVAEKASGSVLFGGGNYKNCGIKTTISDVDGEVFLCANYDETEGYSVKFNETGVVLEKNGIQIGFSQEVICDHDTIAFETAELGDMAFIRVLINGDVVISYFDENAIGEGYLGIGVNNASAIFEDIEFIAFDTNEEIIGSISDAVLAYEKFTEDISLTNLNAAKSLIEALENRCAVDVLTALVTETEENNKEMLEPKHECELFEFSINGESVVPEYGLVEITLPTNTDIFALKASFSVSMGAKVYVDTIEQVSGVTVNDFTDDIKYKVVAEDGVNFSEYLVKVYLIDASDKTSYNSEKDFSGTQGENGWSYMYRNISEGEFSAPVELCYNDVSWNEGRWSGYGTLNSVEFGFIGSVRIHPGKSEANEISCLRVFNVPMSGKIKIDKVGDISSSISDSSSVNFNVRIRVLKNDTVIWPKNSDGWERITGNTTLSNLETLYAEVNTGDRIIFEVSSDGMANTVNSLDWVSQIDYMEMEDAVVYSSNSSISEATTIGETDWTDYSLSGKFSAELGNSKNIIIEFFKNETESYALRIFNDKILIMKDNTIIKTVYSKTEDNREYSYNIKTEKLPDGTLISVFVDEKICATVKDSSYIYPAGKVAFYGNATKYSFSDIILTVTAEKSETDALDMAHGSILAFEKDKTVENYKAALENIKNLEDGFGKTIFESRMNSLVKNFRYLTASVNTADRILTVDGLDYNLRNSSVELIIFDDSGYTMNIASTVDHKGRISGTAVLGENVKSGTLNIKTSDGALCGTFKYRKISSECEIKSFCIDGVYGKINDNSINIGLTKPTDIGSMIALYEVSDYAMVYVNGVQQENGVTENDFLKNVVYKVVAEDGTERFYTVSVIAPNLSSQGFGGGGGNGGSSGGGMGSAVHNISVENSIINSSGVQSSIYTDVAETRWSYEYIKGLTDKKIVSGSGNGTFEPERNITRAEFVKMLVLALNLTNKGDSPEFVDVTNNDWYYEYVRIAYSNGIVKGYGEIFGANDNISREDMAVMICRSAKNIEATKEADNFLDISEVSDYAFESVISLSKANILNGDNGKIRPGDSATREQAAKMIYLICD